MTMPIPPTKPEWFKHIVIRQCSRNDLPALEWEGEYIHFRRVFLETYNRSLRGLSVLWVADLPNTGLIGQLFVQLNTDRPELADGKTRAYFYSIRVRPSYRSVGLGARLLLVAETDIIRRGFQYATLNVAKENVRAQMFYERHGYARVAHEPGNWSYPDEQGIWHYVEEPAWRMEKKLI